MASQTSELNINAPVRLDKFLSMAGKGTRSEVKKLMKQGLITVNGSSAKKPEQKIIPSKDEIRINGELISVRPIIGIMFHKPAGCVTAATDSLHKTVMDYIDHERKGELFPVGRLDIDTEGLLLMINDGALGHQMLSPRHHVPKTYYVKTDLEITEEDVKSLEAGVDIGEKNLTMPASIKLLSPFEAELTIREGKFHQVKRMFQVCNKKVIYLKRISMAGIDLDDALQPGEFRELSDLEIERIRSYVKEQKSNSV